MSNINQDQSQYQSIVTNYSDIDSTQHQAQPINYQQEISDLNLDRRDQLESESLFPESLQNKFEEYRMSDLVQKFDSLSKNNISKNIMKAFFNYLLDIKENDLLTDFVYKGVKPAYSYKMVKNYLKSFCFNNNSLQKLTSHEKYGKAFEFYLTFEAEKWLAESKVQQKDTHLIYIDFLKLICSNPYYSNHIVTYKKNQKSKFKDRF